AVIGLANVGVLDEFATSFYHRGRGPLTEGCRRIAPVSVCRIERRLQRRHDPAIPAARVRSHPEIDLALALENRLPRASRRAVARWRTRRFDATLARRIARRRPTAALIFSDVGSEFALPACRRLGVRTVLS